MPVPILQSGWVFTSSGGTASTSHTLNPCSSIVAGNLLVAIIANDATNSDAAIFSTAASGWVKDGEGGTASGDAHIAVFTKIATELDGSILINSSASAQLLGWYMQVSGVDDITPVHLSAYNASGASTSHGIPGINTTEDNTLIIYGLSFDGADGDPYSVAGTGFGQVGEGESGTSGNDASGCFGTRNMATQGATGTATVSCAANDGAAFFQLAINSKIIPPLETVAGSYSITQKTYTIEATRILDTTSQLYSLAGQPVEFAIVKEFPVNAGLYAITERLASLSALRNIDLAAGSYSITQNPYIIEAGRNLKAATGSYSITQKSYSTETSRYIGTTPGSYSIAEQLATLSVTKYFHVAAGIYTVAGIEPLLPAEIGARLKPPAGSYIITGKAASLNANLFVPACIGYSFKKEAVVYVVYAGNKYRLDLSEINFSQTFQEHSYSIKSMQVRNMFEQSVINKANPASFDITFPAIREDDLRVLFDRALDYNSFAIYVESIRGNFYIENCVITNANFIIEKMRPLSMSIQGEASKVSKVATEDQATLIPRDANRTYNRISDLAVDISGTRPMGNALNAISVELQNEVAWTPYTHVDGAIDTTDTTDTMYPGNYTVKKRTLAGTFTKYLLDTETVDLFRWNRNTSMQLFAGQDGYGFDLDIANCSYTNRIGTGNVFTQSFDWRMTQNPADLSSVVTYITY